MVSGKLVNLFIIWLHGKIWGHQTMLNNGTIRTLWRSVLFNLVSILASHYRSFAWELALLYDSAEFGCFRWILRHLLFLFFFFFLLLILLNCIDSVECKQRYGTGRFPHCQCLFVGDIYVKMAKEILMPFGVLGQMGSRVYWMDEGADGSILRDSFGGLIWGSPL